MADADSGPRRRRAEGGGAEGGGRRAEGGGRRAEGGGRRAEGGGRRAEGGGGRRRRMMADCGGRIGHGSGRIEERCMPAHAVGLIVAGLWQMALLIGELGNGYAISGGRAIDQHSAVLPLPFSNAPGRDETDGSTPRFLRRPRSGRGLSCLDLPDRGRFFGSRDRPESGRWSGGGAGRRGGERSRDVSFEGSNANGPLHSGRSDRKPSDR